MASRTGGVGEARPRPGSLVRMGLGQCRLPDERLAVSGQPPSKVLDAFFGDAFRRAMYETVASLQEDFDAWLKESNDEQIYQAYWNSRG